MISLRHSLAMVSDPLHLDASVEEVFGMMLGVICQKISPGEAEDGMQNGNTDLDDITAVVGFAGLLSGACIFRSSGGTALAIAGKLTGTAFFEIDDTVQDAIGEICNMLAGTWKRQVPELSSNCGLSIPAVVTGSNYRIHIQAPEFRLHQSYAFENASFAVTIICDALQ